MCLQFIVEDSGIGIPNEQKALIFDEFQKHNASNQGIYEGQGLGLNIVKHHLKDLNGVIDFESEEGKGSQFTVRTL